MKDLALLVLVATALALPARAQPAIVAEPFPPAKFNSLYIQREEGDTITSVQLVGDAVTYTVLKKGKVVENSTTHPGGDDWFKFIQALNSTKVYKWRAHYSFPGHDNAWAIALTMDERKFSSDGQNEFPKDGDESQPQGVPQAPPSMPFLLFWNSVLTLVGKAPAAKN